jgi:protein CpxP
MGEMAMKDSTTSNSRRRRWLSAVALAAAFVAGGLTMTGVVATAQTGDPHHMMMMGGGAHADMHAHIGKALDAVGATPEQKAKIEQILHTGLKPMMEAHEMSALHKGLVAALTGPTVDRGALEQLRAEEVGKLDQASRSMTQAVADAADVLRPDQRAKLATLMAEHHHPS